MAASDAQASYDAFNKAVAAASAAEAAGGRIPTNDRAAILHTLSPPRKKQLLVVPSAPRKPLVGISKFQQ